MIRSIMRLTVAILLSSLCCAGAVRADSGRASTAHSLSAKSHRRHSQQARADKPKEETLAEKMDRCKTGDAQNDPLCGL